MKVYPSWRFHRTLPACIVADPNEDDALGEGWAMTPAAFLEDEPGPGPAAKPPAAETPAAAPGHALAPGAVAEHTIAVLLEEPEAPKLAGHAAAVLLEEHRPAKPEADKCLKPKTTKPTTKKRKHR